MGKSHNPILEQQWNSAPFPGATSFFASHFRIHISGLSIHHMMCNNGPNAGKTCTAASHDLHHLHKSSRGKVSNKKKMNHPRHGCQTCRRSLAYLPYRYSSQKSRNPARNTRMRGSIQGVISTVLRKMSVRLPLAKSVGYLKMSLQHSQREPPNPWRVKTGWTASPNRQPSQVGDTPPPSLTLKLFVQGSIIGGENQKKPMRTRVDV